MKNKYFLIISAVVVLIAGFFVAKNFVAQDKAQHNAMTAHVHADAFIRDYSYRIGSDDAKVRLVEFMDPECESCRAMHPEVKRILAEYNGGVQLIIRYAPFHPNSKIAIGVLEAARKQNKYDEVLDVLFEYQPAWGDHHNPRPELIWTYMQTIEGLDVEKLRADTTSPEIERIINQDIEDGRRLEVKATPTFFVNGRSLPRYGVAYLRELIKEEHSK